MELNKEQFDGIFAKYAKLIKYVPEPINQQEIETPIYEPTPTPEEVPIYKPTPIPGPQPISIEQYKRRQQNQQNAYITFLEDSSKINKKPKTRAGKAKQYRRETSELYRQIHLSKGEKKAANIKKLMELKRDWHKKQKLDKY